MDEHTITTQDVGLNRESFREFPRGWRSPEGVMEGFMLAGALEIQARRRVNPYNPWASDVLRLLPRKFQHDGLGSLVAVGPNHPEEWHRPATSLDPATNFLQSRYLFQSGEQVGRLVLLGLVWKMVDEVYAATSHLRSRDLGGGYQRALGELGGTILGQHGTVLFTAALHSKWFSASEPRQLTAIERSFLEGQTIYSGTGKLAASGSLYVDSIWNLVFRLVERRSPEYYINLYRDKIDTVEYIISKRAADEAAGFSIGGVHRWTGWPEEAEQFAPPPSPKVGVSNLGLGKFVDSAGIIHEPHWVNEGTYWMSGVYLIEACCTCGKYIKRDGDPDAVRASIRREFQEPGSHEMASWEAPHRSCREEPEHLLFPAGR